ncbi:hypothetical protein FACS18949_17940 [Clostridia bacterium]|nr:hypothetical protein FACS18949_17940 [Clostridia bacterium]
MKIEELADSIRESGLLNPLTVMPTDDGDFLLLAGLRRLRAIQHLGWIEVEVNAITPKDAEDTLKIEICENEQRQDFTFSEKMDYGRQLERLEAAKAKERMLSGKSDPVPNRAQGRPRTRAVVGEKIGMTGQDYQRAKYIAENAPQDVIEQLDKGEQSIRKTYDNLRAAVNLEAKPAAEMPTILQIQAKPKAKPKANPLDLISAKEREQIAKNCMFDALPPNEKIDELQRQLRTERARAASAESELTRERELRKNDNYHNSGTIEMLTRQNAELVARIKELEGKYESD